MLSLSCLFLRNDPTCIWLKLLKMCPNISVAKMWSEKFMLERKWSVAARDRGRILAKSRNFQTLPPDEHLAKFVMRSKDGRKTLGGQLAIKLIKLWVQQHTLLEISALPIESKCRPNDGVAWHWIPGCRSELMLSTLRTLLQCPETLMTQQHPLRLHKGQGKVSSSMGIKIRAWTFCVTSKPWKYV